MSRMYANVGNAARMTHDQTRGQVHFPESQAVAGQLGNSPKDRKALAWLEQQVKPAWSNQELCSE